MIMNTKKAMLAFSIAALLLAGCEKSAPTNNTQSATPQQSAETQPAPAPAPAPEPLKPLVVPAGTSLPVILGQTINSRVNSAGEEFAGTLASDISVDGEIAIPKGADVSGVITKSKKQGTFKGQADLAIQLRSIRVGGKSYPISSSTYAQSVKGKGKRTAVVTGGGAAVGALIGGLAGGGKGAAIGAGVGGAGGLAASGATGGENVTLAAESRVTFKLTQSVTIDR
jgi:glucose/arabinose dehydrogenase